MKIFSGFEFAGQAVGETNISHFQLRIEAPRIDQQIKRKPLNLAVVIDRSGSMKGEKLKYAKQAVKTFIQNLSSHDIISLVIFDNRIKLLRPAENVKNKSEIYKIIDEITPAGTTNLSGGWELGYEQIISNNNPEYINRIILLTDGLANEGIINKAVLLELGKKFAEADIETTTIGVGDDFDEDLLKKIANISRGNFYFIENPDMTPEIFKLEVGELLSLCAQKLELTLNWLNGVQLKNIFTDYVIKNQDDKSITLELDDANAEDEKSLLFLLDFPGVHEIGTYEVVQAELKYRQLLPKIENKILEMTASRNVLTKDDFMLQTPDENVLLEIALVKAAVARMESYYFTKSGDLDAASKTLTASSFELNGISEALRSIGLQESAKSVKLESDTLRIDVEDVTNFKVSADKNLLYKAMNHLRRKGHKNSKESHEKQIDDPDNQDS